MINDLLLSEKESIAVFPLYDSELDLEFLPPPQVIFYQRDALRNAAFAYQGHRSWGLGGGVLRHPENM